jgi:MoaA/NifB/PqqE/SkfB family radical SAM enzyme
MTGYVQHVKRLPRPPSSRLRRLDIELTERCNNDCIHCCINLPANDRAAQSREMTTTQVKDVLRQAADLGCLRVRFTGGEPLLRPDFEELYLFARRLGMKVLLFTNARLITPHLSDLFARILPLVPIEVTVYGMRAASYEAVTRAPGSFAQFWRGVNLLLEHRIPFVVKSALLPPNRGEMDEFEAWARTIPWMSKPPSYSMFFDLRNRRDDVDKSRLIESLRLSPQEGLAVLTRDVVKYRKKMSRFASKFMGPPGDALFRCGAGHGLCVDAYGRAQPCMGIRAPELTVPLTPRPSPKKRGEHLPLPGGEGRGEGLASTLAQFARLREMRATNPEYLQRCARCFLKGLCLQCPAKSWAEYGTLDTPVEYLCDVAHAQARWLEWVGKDEHGWEVTDWKERIKVEERNLTREPGGKDNEREKQDRKETLAET